MTCCSNGMPGSIVPLRTARLDLVAITPACLRSELARDGALADHLGCEVTAEWPPNVWEPHVWELLLEHYAAQPDQMAWHRYVILRGTRERGPVLIGTVNAFRWPDKRGEAELGYAVVPAYYRQGFATEAALAMVQWIEAGREVTSLCAHTYPELTASARILDRCGFALQGPGAEERTFRYFKAIAAVT